MRGLDFTSWQSLMTTLIGLALFTLIGMGIRLLVTFTIQQRRERQNRQINERLRTLIAAYKVLGGSFTGDLSVDPAHLRDLHHAAAAAAHEAGDDDEQPGETGSDRRRRIRDAVEAALSDIVLLGTEEQVRLAAHAVNELVGGRPVPTHELVVALRTFIREALDLAPIPADVTLPAQGPTRPSGGKGQGRGGSERSAGGRSGGGGGGGMGGMGGGMGGMGGGMGAGIGGGRGEDDPSAPDGRR